MIYISVCRLNQGTALTFTTCQQNPNSHSLCHAAKKMSLSSFKDDIKACLQ